MSIPFLSSWYVELSTSYGYNFCQVYDIALELIDLSTMVEILYFFLISF